MSIIPSSFSWMSFFIGILASQFLLPLILGLIGKMRAGGSKTAAQ